MKTYLSLEPLAPRIILVTFCLEVVLEWTVVLLYPTENLWVSLPLLGLPKALGRTPNPIPFNHLFFFLVSVPSLWSHVIQGLDFSSHLTSYSRHIGLFANEAYFAVLV